MIKKRHHRCPGIGREDVEDIWNEIEAFLNGLMDKEQEERFRDKLRKDDQLREMVAFFKAVEMTWRN